MMIVSFVCGLRGLGHRASCIVNGVHRSSCTASANSLRTLVLQVPLAVIGARRFGFKGPLFALVPAMSLG